MNSDTDLRALQMNIIHPKWHMKIYPLNVEPWEPNITTKVNFDAKWKKLIAKDTPLPTPNE